MDLTRQDIEHIRRMQYGGGLGSGCGPKIYAACLIMMIVLMLTGCKTIKSAESHTENNTEVKTDSTNIETVKKDSTDVQHSTNVTEKEKTHTESHTEQRDSFVTVVDQNGNVVGTKEYHWLKESLKESSEREKRLEDSLMIYRHKSDSIGYYRAKLDSISSIKQDEKIVEVEKQRSIKEKITTFLTDAVIGVIIFILVIWLVRLISKRP